MGGRWPTSSRRVRFRTFCWAFRSITNRLNQFVSCKVMMTNMKMNWGLFEKEMFVKLTQSILLLPLLYLVFRSLIGLLCFTFVRIESIVNSNSSGSSSSSSSSISPSELTTIADDYLSNGWNFDSSSINWFSIPALEWLLVEALGSGYCRYNL